MYLIGGDAMKEGSNKKTGLRITADLSREAFSCEKPPGLEANPNTSAQGRNRICQLVGRLEIV